MAKQQQVPDEQGLQALIGTLYDAAMSPADWPAAIASMARAFGAVSGDFHAWNARNRAFEFAYSHNMEHMIADYAAHYIYLNPRIDFWDTDPERTLIYDYMHIDERGIDRDEFYNWMERECDGRYGVGMRMENSAARQVVCGVQFDRRHGHVEPAVVERFQLLGPHLMRAARLMRRLEGENLKARALGEAVQAVACGVLLVDAGGRVLQTNTAAEEALAARDGLATDGRELRAARPQETKKLREAIASVACPSVLKAGETRLTLLVPRPSGRPPYEVLVAPVPCRNPYPAGGASAILLITIPEAPVTFSPDLLRDHFGLTPAETRLCNALLQGGELPVLAQRLGIAPSTARTRLNRVLDKTGTHRQPELVALLYRLRRGWR